MFTVYSVDAHTLSFRLVIPPNKRTHERYEGSPVVKGNRWAFAWWQGSRRLLSVGNIIGQPNKEVTMDIGAFKFQVSLFFLISLTLLTLRFRQPYRSCRIIRYCSLVVQVSCYLKSQSFKPAMFEAPCVAALFGHILSILSTTMYILSSAHQN